MNRESVDLILGVAHEGPLVPRNISLSAKLKMTDNPGHFCRGVARKVLILRPSLDAGAVGITFTHWSPVPLLDRIAGLALKPSMG